MDIKKLYLVTTLKCNLKCAHCYIDEIEETFNEEEFLKKMNSFDGRLILFGGEFTTNMDRFRIITSSNEKDGISKIAGCTTNLTILNDELIVYYKKLRGVGTSWNVDRFGNDKTYQLWLNNLKTLISEKIGITILITLTKDLIEIPVDKFLTIAQDFDHKSLNIKFEHFVGDVYPGFYEKVDDWLCELYQKWNLQGRGNLDEQWISTWYYNCNETYTLFPDGTMINRCPQNLPSKVSNECLVCERYDICRPCRLIPYCTFPKKLAKLIENNKK